MLGSILSSSRSALSLQKTLDLANLYLENARKVSAAEKPTDKAFKIACYRKHENVLLLPAAFMVSLPAVRSFSASARSDIQQWQSKLTK